MFAVLLKNVQTLAGRSTSETTPLSSADLILYSGSFQHQRDYASADSPTSRTTADSGWVCPPIGRSTIRIVLVGLLDPRPRRIGTQKTAPLLTQPLGVALCSIIPGTLSTWLSRIWLKEIDGESFI